jgi:hypothetical protein
MFRLPYGQDPSLIVRVLMPLPEEELVLVVVVDVVGVLLVS